MSVSTSQANEDCTWSTYLGELIRDKRISGVAFLPPGCELQSPAKLRPALFAQGALEGISPADWAQLGGVFDHIEEAEENRYVVADPGSDHIAGMAAEQCQAEPDGANVVAVLRLKGRSFHAVRRTPSAVYYTSHGRRFELLVNNLPMGMLLVTFGLPDMPQQMIPVVDSFCERIRVALG